MKKNQCCAAARARGLMDAPSEAEAEVEQQEKEPVRPSGWSPPTGETE